MKYHDINPSGCKPRPMDLGHGVLTLLCFMGLWMAGCSMKPYAPPATGDPNATIEFVARNIGEDDWLTSTSLFVDQDNTCEWNRKSTRRIAELTSEDRSELIRAEAETPFGFKFGYRYIERTLTCNKARSCSVCGKFTPERNARYQVVFEPTDGCQVSLYQLEGRHKRKISYEACGDRPRYFYYPYPLQVDTIEFLETQETQEAPTTPVDSLSTPHLDPVYL
jgi:hypothetical protein